MKTGFYPKLAVEGIRKNKRLYVPYLLTCILMIAVFYILAFLSNSAFLEEFAGGGSLRVVLNLGSIVIAVFSVIFLFYTHSFLIRRRKKEFGLYSMLGMSRRNISRILFWEMLTSSILSLLCGLFVGIALSKLAELGLINIIRENIDYRFTLSSIAVWRTLLFYAVIFLLIFLNALRQVRFAKPAELFKSESLGEKPPKANWVFAVVGVLLLAGAYYIAVSIKSPITALAVFFIAVLMVIVATYLLFISGSVALCRILQRNRKYYYKKSHFISISSMAYRMKRNGAGLASICILSTMVLVMISSSSSLYFGANDSISSRYVRENMISFHMYDMDDFTSEADDQLRRAYENAFETCGVTPENVLEYRYATTVGLQDGDFFDLDGAAGYQYDIVPMDNLRMLSFMSAEDYNRYTGKDVSVAPGEALICCTQCSYKYDTLTFDGITLEIAGDLDAALQLSDMEVTIIPSLFLVISDYEQLRPIAELRNSFDYPVLEMELCYGYDLKGSTDEILRVFNEVTSSVRTADFIGDGAYSYSSSCAAGEMSDFYGTYGGLFFIGIMLSIVFLVAAVLIIYYKQVSEGHEDRSRFEIMQKVGMTAQDIRKSINSQMLTVFFAPLLMAGLHLAFAFPLVWKILQLFQLHNLKLVILVTVGAFLVFGIFYTIIYRLTANVYFGIVSSRNKE